MNDSGKYTGMLREYGWSEVRKGKGTHEIWRCPPECGEHQVSIPSRASGSGFDKNSPINKRITRCQEDLERKRAQAAALAAVVNPPTPEPASGPAPTPAPGTEEPQPVREPAPARPVETDAPGGPLEVIAREPALAHHPKLGAERMVPVGGASKVLMSDGSEHYECDDCDYVGASGTAVRSHRNQTHNRKNPPQPHTDERTIRKVIRAVQAAKASGVRNFGEVAADTLNRAGIKPSRAALWTPHAVSALYNDHKDKVSDVSTPAPVPAPRPAAPRPAPPRIPVPASAATPAKRPEQPITDPASASLEEVAWLLVQLARRVDVIRQEHEKEIESAAVVDDETRRKAAKWDQMKDLMGG